MQALHRSILTAMFLVSSALVLSVSVRADGTNVATPTFNPDGGTFNEAIDVVVACETAEAAIHYTTDGSEPSEESPTIVSGNSIHLDETTTLTAKAYCAGMDPATKSATFTLLIGALGIPPAEFNALVDLYNSTDGPNWTDHTNWLTADAPWFGVTVEEGHVTSVELINNSLTGPLPSSISNLTALVNLSLGMNNLTGQIPVEICNLANLQWLRLWVNQLEGAIPDEIGNLTELRDFGVGANLLTGSIPASIGNLTLLESFTADNNSLSGGLPATIGNLANLTCLGLGANQLSGGIPVEIGDMQNLILLWLDNNEFSGVIPAEIANLPLLREFIVTNNHLEGSIPAAIGNLANLTCLGLGGNQLSGGIPAEIGDMQNLLLLWLDNNQFSGGIPAEIGNLPLLQVFNVFNNHLEGSIPAAIGSLAELRALYLGANLFSGGIPAEIGDLSLLERLGLAGNRLSGEIPPTLANLTKINWLELGSNQLKASNPELLAYLDAHAPWGADTQTVEPANLVVGGGNASSVILTWEPIVYAWDDGYYEVGISEEAGGPYAFDPANRTSDKWASSLQVGGLSPGTTYHFVVRTVTLPLWINQSTLTSDPSNEVTITLNALGVSQAEYDALVALYQGTDGDNWADNTNWLTNDAPWFGVDTQNGHIVGLHLGSNNLAGSLPVELADLVRIRGIWLDRNHLYGAIPAGLGNLAALESLALSVNQLSGGIPSEIGNLTELKDLWLDGNQLTGPIPPGLGNLGSLLTLQLSDNQLTGAIPAELGNLTNLINLWVGNNQVSGAIPAALGDLARLESLSLGLNNLTGAIPPELGNLTNLTGMWLNRNQLTGTVPNLGALTRMVTLDLSQNALSGPIPSWLPDMTSLLNLELYRNQFTGTIPAALGAMSQLHRLTLSYNNLDGSIPAELSGMHDLTYVSLAGNSLTGTIPAWFASLPNLTGLSLRINRFSGAIPAELGNMTQLTALALGNNQLSGEIPASLANLTNIAAVGGLMLEYNCLEAHGAALIAYLDTMNPGWASTQTIAPGNVHVTGRGTDHISLAWNPVGYTGDGGWYEVGISATSGGPYAFDPANRTSNKSSGEITITGITAGTEKYFVVRTFTPAHGVWNSPTSNKSDLTSGLSVETSGRTLTSEEAFALWIGGLNWTGFTNPDLSPAGDPDGDMMTNQEEFAFGLDPRSGASVNPVTNGLSGTEFSYIRRAGTGLGYVVCYSTDLLTWTRDNAAIQTVMDSTGDVDTVAVMLSSAAVPAGGRLFVRVLAE